MIPELLGLLAPGPALPPTIPGLPPPLSPGSVIIMLLAGAASILEQTQPKPEEDATKKQDEQTQKKEDNKHVVKMADVAAEIDRQLNSKIIVPLIFREILATLTTRGGSGFTQWQDLSTRVSDKAFDPIRSELKQAIRMHELQQQTRRKKLSSIKSNQRQGSLHGRFHTRRPATGVA